MGAEDLTNGLIEASDDIGKKLNHAAIGLAKLDYEDFMKGDYFKGGRVYIDEAKETYKALNFGSKSIFSLYGMANPFVYVKGYEAKKRGITGNMKGDGLQLGGTMVVDSNGEVIYKHTQKDYTDNPKVEDIIEAVKNYSPKF
jgi:prostamide/prostaglandin F2alpha synthase